jgi:hypothetical protein
VRGLIKNDRILDLGPLTSDLVKSILAPDCPVSAALTEQDKVDLRALLKEAQPSDSKP